MINTEKNISSGKGIPTKRFPFNHNAFVKRAHTIDSKLIDEFMNKEELNSPNISSVNTTSNNIMTTPIKNSQMSGLDSNVIGNTLDVIMKPTLNLNAASFIPKLSSKTTMVVNPSLAYTNDANKRASNYLLQGGKNLAYQTYIQSASLDASAKSTFSHRDSSDQTPLNKETNRIPDSLFSTNRVNSHIIPYCTPIMEIHSSESNSLSNQAHSSKLTLSLKSNAYVPKRYADGSPKKSESIYEYPTQRALISVNIDNDRSNEVFQDLKIETEPTSSVLEQLEVCSIYNQNNEIEVIEESHETNRNNSQSIEAINSQHLHLSSESQVECNVMDNGLSQFDLHLPNSDDNWLNQRSEEESKHEVQSSDSQEKANFSHKSELITLLKTRIEEETENKLRSEVESIPRIEKQYFLVTENKPKSINIMKIDYMYKFSSLPITRKTDLLSEITISHLERMNVREEVKLQRYENSKCKGNLGSNIIRSSAAQRGENSQCAPKIKTLDYWRRDYSQSVSEAEIMREQILKARNQDTLRDDLINLLNKITVDTYKDTLASLLILIKEDVEAQNKLLSVLFDKALTGGTYISLYAQLCKDLDKQLPQKFESKDKGPIQSLFRKNLLEKSKKIFSLKSLDLDAQGEKEEQILKFKKCVLGNVNFISELISAKVVSKSVCFQCLNSLFSKLETNMYQNQDVSRAMQLMIIEAICLLLDKFGTFINIQDKTIKPEILESSNKDLEKQICKVEKYILDNSGSMPGHIQFKVINLIEKKKRGWELSEVDKLQKAKGLKELNDDSIKKIQEKESIKCIPHDKICRELKAEIISFRESIAVDTYKNWEISTNFYNNGVELASMAQAIIDVSNDYVSNSKVAEDVSTYITELFNYYRREADHEKKKLREKTIEILLTVSDLLLDNKLMSIVVGQLVISNIIFYNLKLSDLDSICITEEQAEGIFEVAKIMFCNLKLESQKNQLQDAYSRLKIVEKYPRLQLVNK